MTALVGNLAALPLASPWQAPSETMLSAWQGRDRPAAASRFAGDGLGRQPHRAEHDGHDYQALHVRIPASADLAGCGGGLHYVRSRTYA
jgi:hypothetical protein